MQCSLNPFVFFYRISPKHRIFKITGSNRQSQLRRGINCYFDYKFTISCNRFIDSIVLGEVKQGRKVFDKMFKKAVEAKSQQRLSGADRKKLKRTVRDRYPSVSDADIDLLLPPKVSHTICHFYSSKLLTLCVFRKFMFCNSFLWCHMHV